MEVYVLALLLVAASVSCRPTLQDIEEPTCSNRGDRDACRCDASCAEYGDCCLDAPSFVSEQQRLGASPFTCESFDNTNVYMMSSCPLGWTDPHTRFHCEHPDTSYRDPLFDVPVTNNRTNITYRNWHCATCHSDLDASTTNIWSVYFSCENAHVNLDSEEFLNHMDYNAITASWILNITENPEFLIFENIEDYRPDRRLYSCRVGVLAPEELQPVLRTCNSSAVDTCPENWTDHGVRAQCEAYTAHVCHNEAVYRNHYCGICNNNGTFQGSLCHWVNWRQGTVTPLPDFSVLLDWRRLRKRSTCQLGTEEYDPFARTCRKVFEKIKGLDVDASNVGGIVALHQSKDNSGISLEDMAPENYTRQHSVSANTTNNETFVSSLDTCRKIKLESYEYYTEDNDSTIVSVPAHNRSFQPDEYMIDNDSRLIICLPEFDSDDSDDGADAEGLVYVTTVGLCLSILFLTLHLAVFAMTPKLHNLSSMNLASLSISLLLMYCAFFPGFYLEQTGIPCVVLAVIIHYGLLASFCWMLTIAYDISRLLQQTTRKLLLSKGKHWQRFGMYSLWSWMIPALIVGAELAVEFIEQVPEDLRPGFGVNNCWFNSSSALLIFTVAPLVVVMILNAAFFIWSAYLIYATTSEMQNASKTHKDFRLYVRLALIMGLTWIIGLIAGYVDVLEIWYLFVLFNTLQGLFIFLAFTCTKKVWRGLCSEQGWQPSKPAQRAAFIPGTATTST